MTRATRGAPAAGAARVPPAAAGQLGDPCPCASCSTYCIGLTQAAVEEFAALDGAGAASYAALCLPVADGWACGFGCDRLVGTLDADLARLCQVLGGRCSPTVESGQRLWCIP